jgi:glycyl-tRNA synthetase beta chain
MPRGEFLLEVRAEEIPARMLAGATREMSTRFFEELMGRGLAPKEIETGFTPRRLVLAMKGLPGKEKDRVEDIFGPPLSVAFKDGRLTPAAEGFARKVGTGTDELLVVRARPGEPFQTSYFLKKIVDQSATLIDTEAVHYLAYRRTVEGRGTAVILAELVPKILAALHWPKTMLWGEAEGPWVRPVHGLVAVFSGRPLDCSLFGVAAGNKTVGHPVLSPRPFAVTGFDDYRRKLAARGIEISPAARRERIARDIAQRASGLGGVAVEDEALLEKLAAICEIPGVMQGALPESLLALPKEVLQASLRDHQSAFTVERDGRLLPVFFTVMDRLDDPQGRVRAGNEWVVAARLADARFFYGEDRKHPLESRAPRLASLTFHEKLGSYALKSERVERLAAGLCEELGWTDTAPDARSAARLLKLDLTSEMVKEFTSLQGVVGGIYAREDGAPEAVWQAVYDQYLPASTSDRIPRGRAGIVTGIADRLDSLVGLFGLGLVPTGSRDPFGLRRAAQALVRLSIEGKAPFDLERSVRAAHGGYQGTLPRGADAVVPVLRSFIEDRVRYLLGLDGFAHDEIEAALGAASADLPDRVARATAIRQARSDEGFLKVVLAAKRIQNILPADFHGVLDPSLLRDSAEVALFSAFGALRTRIEAAARARDYAQALAAIAQFAAPLDRFFTEVLVMDPDPAVRTHRLALLQAIHQTLTKVGKLTEVVVDKS